MKIEKDENWEHGNVLCCRLVDEFAPPEAVEESSSVMSSCRICTTVTHRHRR